MKIIALLCLVTAAAALPAGENVAKDADLPPAPKLPVDDKGSEISAPLPQALDPAIENVNLPSESAIKEAKDEAVYNRSESKESKEPNDADKQESEKPKVSEPEKLEDPEEPKTNQKKDSKSKDVREDKDDGVIKHSYRVILMPSLDTGRPGLFSNIIHWLYNLSDDDLPVAGREPERVFAEEPEREFAEEPERGFVEEPEREIAEEPDREFAEGPRYIIDVNPRDFAY